MTTDPFSRFRLPLLAHDPPAPALPPTPAPIDARKTADAIVLAGQRRRGEVPEEPLSLQAAPAMVVADPQALALAIIAAAKKARTKT